MITVVLIVAAAFSGLTLVLLLAPIQGVLHFTFKEFQPAGWVRLSFLHPLLCTAEVDFATRIFIVRVLGRRMGGKRISSDESAPSRAAGGLDYGDIEVGGMPLPTRSGSADETPAEAPACLMT